MSMLEILFKACAFEIRWGNEKGEIMSNIDKYETRKKMVYDFMCDDMYVPMKIKELCIVLGVKKEDRPQLEQILLDLQAEGRITLSKRGKYSKSEIKKTIRNPQMSLLWRMQALHLMLLSLKRMSILYLETIETTVRTAAMPILAM